MPYLIVAGGSLVLGLIGGFSLSSDTKKVLIYAGVGFATYQLVVK